MNDLRIRNAGYLSREISAAGITHPFRVPGATHVYHQYVVKVEEPFPRSRDQLAEYLKENGIGTAIHYPIPLHRQPLYASSAAENACPVSDQLSQRVLSLPVHPLLSGEDLTRISGAFDRVW
jgi:perosamine synthetase